MATRQKIDSIFKIREKEALEVRMSQTPDDLELTQDAIAELGESVGTIEDAIAELGELLAG